MVTEVVVTHIQVFVLDGKLVNVLSLVLRIYCIKICQRKMIQQQLRYFMMNMLRMLLRQSQIRSRG